MSSKKGGEFERDMARAFSLWWTKSERDDIFWRTHASGGRATTRHKAGLQTADSYGDLMAMHEIGKPLTNKVVIELKRGYSKKRNQKRTVSLLSLLDTPPGQKTRPIIYQWLMKVNKIRRRAKRERYMIVFKRDRKEPCIIISYTFFADLIYTNNKIFHSSYQKNFIKVKAGGHPLVILPLYEFFQWCRPESMGKV